MRPERVNIGCQRTVWNVHKQQSPAVRGFAEVQWTSLDVDGHGLGGEGDSYDNALAETINGLYKAELIHRRAPWKTKEAVELATLEWVAWFNNHRLLQPIGYIPPAEAESNYYRHLASQATVVAA